MLNVPLPFELAKRYRLLSPIARGGFATVYEATPLLRASCGGAERVAVKVIDVRRVERAGLDPRHELEVLAAIKESGHAAWCRYFEWGELDLTEQETDAPVRALWIAMERLRGADLAEMLEVFRLTGLHLPESLVRQFAHQFLPALHALHERGVVHADLKPQNIRVENGVFRLFDFGIARFRQGETVAVLDSADDTAKILGSPRYLAPEQVSQRQVTRRSDVFSLGVILYEMLTNRLPYDDLDHLGMPRVYHGRWDEQGKFIPAKATPPLVSKLRPQVGTAWDAPLRKAIQLDPYQRQASAEELLAQVPPCVPLTTPDEPLVLAPSAGRRHTLPPANRRRAIAAAAASLLAGALLGAGGLWIADPDVRPFGGGAGAGAASAAGGQALEERVLAHMNDQLMSRRTHDGGYAFAYHWDSDHWTSAQALAALALSPVAPPEGLVTDLLALIEAGRLDAVHGGSFRGWGFDVEDTVSGIEASAWPALAIALTGGSQDPDRVASPRRVAQWLLSVQNPDGSFSTIPELGPRASRVSASTFATLGMIALAAADPDAADPLLDGIERAAAWLADAYRSDEGAYRPDPRSTFTLGTKIAGLTEQTAYALLEARALLREAGRTPPPRVDHVLDDIAHRFEPQADRPLATIGSSPGEDYMFALPEGDRSSLLPVRFTWYPWRLLLAASLATEPEAPNRAAWAREATLLRRRLPDAVEKLRREPTYLFAEVTFAANLLTATPPGERPSLARAAAARQ